MNKEFLKAYRQILGLSQEAMGQKLGITKQMVSLMELGKCEISPKTKRRFYEAFNIGESEIATLIEMQSKLKGAR